MSAAPFYPSQSGRLERCSAAKLELLHAVVLALGDRHRIVEPQRTEWRGPDQADTHRRTDSVAIVVLQPEAGSGINRRGNRGLDATRQIDFAGLRPRGRPLVVEQTAGVGIDRALEPD